MINNELKRLEWLLLLAHVYIRFTSAVKTEQQEVVPLYIGIICILEFTIHLKYQYNNGLRKRRTLDIQELRQNAMASLIVLSYNVFANKQRLSIESLFIFTSTRSTIVKSLHGMLSFEIGGSVCRVITITF